MIVVHNFEQAKATHVSIWLRPKDCLFIGFCVFGILIAFIRGLAALGGNFSIFSYYRISVEPYIDDPIAFGRLQVATHSVVFLLILQRQPPRLPFEEAF